MLGKRFLKHVSEETLGNDFARWIARISIVALLVMIVAGGTIYLSFIAGFHQLKSLVETRQQATRLSQDLADQETGQRGYGLTGDRILLQPFITGTTAYREDASLLQQDASAHPELAPLIRGAIAKGQDWHDRYGLPQIRARQTGTHVAPEQLEAGQIAYDAFTGAISQLENTIQGDLATAQEEVLRTLFLTILAQVFVGIAIGISAIYTTMRRLRKIIDPIKEISTAAELYAARDFEAPALQHTPVYREILSLASHIDSMRLELRDKFRLDSAVRRLSTQFQDSPNLTALYEIVLREFSTLWQADLASIVTVTNRQYRLTCYMEQNQVTNPGTLLDEPYLEALGPVRKGQAVHYADWNQRRPDTPRETAHFRRGIRSSMHLPVSYQGNTIAILNLASQRSNWFTQESVENAMHTLPIVGLAMALKATDDRLKSILNSSQDAIVITDQFNTVITWSHGAELLFAFSEEEVLGQPLDRLVPSVRPTEPTTNECDHRESDEEISFTGPLLCEGLGRDGTRIPIELTRSAWSIGPYTYHSVVIRDVTERMRAQEKLQESENRFRTLFDHVKDGIFVSGLDPTGRATKFLQVNNAACIYLGYTREELLLMTPYDLIDPQMDNAIDRILEELRKARSLTMEITHVASDGRRIPVEISASIAKLGDQKVVLSVARDISERKQVELSIRQSEEQTRSILELSPEMLAVYSDNKLVYVNSAGARLLGAGSTDDVLGMPLDAIILECPSDEDERDEETDAAMPGKILIRLDGQIIDAEVKSSPITYNGRPSTLVLVRDITQQKIYERQLLELNRKLTELSNLDGLTGVGNRRFFDQRLELEWEKAKKTQHPVALILFDIDYFKAFNDTYGHQAGDDCLRQVVGGVKAALNSPDAAFARYGGEEFAVILPNCTLAKARQISEGLREKVADLMIPHMRSKVQPFVTLSVGVASSEANPLADLSRIVEHADKALYLAKQSGRNRVCVYGALHRL